MKLVRYSGKLYRIIVRTRYAITLQSIDDEDNIIITSFDDDNIEWQHPGDNVIAERPELEIKSKPAYIRERAGDKISGRE